MSFINIPAEFEARQEVSLIDSSVMPYAAIPDSLTNSSAKRRREFIAGRLCANRAVARLGSEQAVGMGSDRLPIWPEGIVGSISHSDSLACAVACKAGHCRSIGIDTEPIVAKQTANEIAELVFRDEEEKLLRSIAKTTEELLTITFSVKESVYKCLFPIYEIPFDFQDVQLKPLTYNQLEVTVSADRFPTLSPPTIIARYSNDEQNVFSAAWITN